MTENRKPDTETAATVYLRTPAYRMHAGLNPSAVLEGVPFYDGVCGHVQLGDGTTLWTRNPETFRALAAVLIEAAEKMEQVRAGLGDVEVTQHV